VNTQPARARRTFLKQAAVLAMLSAGAPRLRAAAKPQYRAAVFGATGKGDYGHGLAAVFNGRENVTVVAVSDADAAGRARAVAQLKGARGYADFRELLKKEKPDLVSVAPRQTGERHAMVLAALRAGAHVYSEKPFTATLAEADELLAEAAKKRTLKIAVAHQMRLAPNVQALKKAVDSGLLGEVLEVRAHGKQDARAGGEDMMVLGTHLFDLARLYAGDAMWCTARVTHGGRDITTADARVTKDFVGPVAGDEVFAQFAFASGVNAIFTSRAKSRETAGPWGIELVGSKGRAKILANIPPQITLAGSEKETTRWEPFQPPAAGENFTAANARVVDDWLAAIEQEREPACSGRNAMKAIEMVMAVYHAALSGRRVALPLAERGHPLAPK
jgi:predicted dehydrogenase